MWDEIHRNSRHCVTQTQCDLEDEIGRRLKLKARQTDRPTDRTNGVRQRNWRARRARDGRTEPRRAAAIHAEIQGAEGGQTDARTRTIHCKHPLMPNMRATWEMYISLNFLFKGREVVIGSTNIYRNRVVNISGGRCRT